MASPRNLVNLKSVEKGFGSRSVLQAVTLGIAAGQRIGIVGGNGTGKTTLLRLIAGLETPDAGTVTRTGDLDLAFLAQGDALGAGPTIRTELVGDRPAHVWAGDRLVRQVLDGLLGGVEADRFAAGLDTAIASLSGGERRRVALARVLVDRPELALLDEPTNHLDVEGIDWLAGHLAGRPGALVVITHDRWFLDAVCTATWEIDERRVLQHDGGYAAFVLARAERDVQATAQQARRRQLVRKELAWLRRGPPARTAKPSFRVAAANALIAEQPEVRNSVELLRFATARLGNRVLEAERLCFGFGARPLLDEATWRLGPGERVALVGANGSGKTSLIRLLAGELAPSAGTVERGPTVRLGHLSQGTVEMPGHLSVLESLEAVRERTTTSAGEQLTAATLCERFGFRGDRARTAVRDLSGGERRRLQLMRLLMQEPNVLLLDEPTNDLDIDTLRGLEDLLDRWPGTMVVVSHDRYFVERVCDAVYALAGDGQIRHLPGGIEQYLRSRSEAARGTEPPRATPATATTTPGAARREARKRVRQLERALERVGDSETRLQQEMAVHAADHARLTELAAGLAALRIEREGLETAWLETATALDA